MQSFTSEQKRILLLNPIVLKITNKHVVYRSEFKVKAVELSLRGGRFDLEKMNMKLLFIF